MANLFQLTINELKKICKEKNVSCSGNKALLIEKIQNPGNFQKGLVCSKNGNEYEKIVFLVTSNIKHTSSELPFNTQKIDQLGGSNQRNDIECNFKKNYDIPIEIKKSSTPDWMQTKIYFNRSSVEWMVTENGKIPIQCKNIFSNLLKKYNNKNIFNENIPNLENVTYENWLKEKHRFKDVYLSCPNDTIANLYNKKGCFYIQISNKGLYHLGSDPCNFKVPYFSCPQKLRIRIKVHSKKNKNGFASLSPMLSCLPKNIKHLEPSPYSLDKIDTIPEQLVRFDEK